MDGNWNSRGKAQPRPELDPTPQVTVQTAAPLIARGLWRLTHLRDYTSMFSSQRLSVVVLVCLQRSVWKQTVQILKWGGDKNAWR